MRAQPTYMYIPIIQSSVNGEYDMKVVWVANNCDVLDGNVRSVTLGNMK